MVPSELVGTFALPRDGNRALGYGGGRDYSIGSSKALGLSDQPPETARANNYKNKEFISYPKVSPGFWVVESWKSGP